MSAETQDPVDRAVIAFQAGIDQEENYRILVEHHYQAVKGFLAKRVFSTEECLDLTQDIFLKVYQGLNDFRRDARFRTWLFQIAHYTYLAWLQRQKRERREDRETASPGDPGEPAAFDEHALVSVTPPTQTDDVLREERLQKLREAIDALPDQMRKCTKLRIYQDRSYKEIAEFMDLSIETVKVHLHMARKKLKEMLRDYHEEIHPERRGRQ